MLEFRSLFCYKISPRRSDFCRHILSRRAANDLESASDAPTSPPAKRDHMDTPGITQQQIVNAEMPARYSHMPMRVEKFHHVENVYASSQQLSQHAIIFKEFRSNFTCKSKPGHASKHDGDRIYGSGFEGHY